MWPHAALAASSRSPTPSSASHVEVSERLRVSYQARDSSTSGSWPTVAEKRTLRRCNVVRSSGKCVLPTAYTRNEPLSSPTSSYGRGLSSRKQRSARREAMLCSTCNLEGSLGNTPSTRLCE